MGSLDAEQSAWEGLREAARCAALLDPRFPPVSAGELLDLRIHISLLSPPVPMQSLEALELGRHGILIRKRGRRGLFLPQVATDHRLDRETFLSRCCSEKAGLPVDAWRDPDTEVLLFTTEIHAEPDD